MKYLQLLQLTVLLLQVCNVSSIWEAFYELEKAKTSTTTTTAPTTTATTTTKGKKMKKNSTCFEFFSFALLHIISHNIDT